MLEILLQNLLDNANKYTPEGGDIAVTVSLVEGKPRLVIEDSGPGVSPEDQALVFERFYRAGDHAASSQAGSGLGLAIVQHIVQLHNAEIHLGSSELLSGLAVTVDFEPGGSEAVQ
jgi:signal transduction histidine kinase